MRMCSTVRLFLRLNLASHDILHNVCLLSSTSGRHPYGKKISCCEQVKLFFLNRQQVAVDSIVQISLVMSQFGYLFG